MTAPHTTSLTVGEVARLAGVTVRTLHHYEAIGLLVPSGRTAAGYRLYHEADIDRLSQVLYYRALGFPLDQIATMLDDPGADAVAHLERQRELLLARMHQLEAMLEAIDRAREAHMTGYNLTPAEKLEVFGEFDPDQYEEEARERWGDTDAWQQSRQRTARYTRADWEAIRREADDLNAGMVALMQAGEPATGQAAMDLAEAHRQHISRWFYPCGYDIHTGLAEMYVTDHRFTENIDRTATGLAAYMREAILANAARSGE